MNAIYIEQFNLFFCIYAVAFWGWPLKCINFCFSVQSWLEAIEDHSAYSTHYCTQEQLSSDDEEDDTVSVTDLQETLKVRTKYLFRVSRQLQLHCFVQGYFRVLLAKSNGSFFPWVRKWCLYLHFLLWYIPVWTVCIKWHVYSSYRMVFFSFQFYQHYRVESCFKSFSQEREPCILCLYSSFDVTKVNLQLYVPL